MIVIDASALFELLVGVTPRVPALAARIAVEDLHAPHLIDLEVVSALRSAEARGTMTSQGAAAAMSVLSSLALTRHPHDLFIARVWHLRPNLTPYDAVYIALAESMSVPLVTCDARIANAPGHSARVEVF